MHWGHTWDGGSCSILEETASPVRFRVDAPLPSQHAQQYFVAPGQCSCGS